MLILNAQLLFLYFVALFGSTERLGITHELTPPKFPDACEGNVTLRGQYQISEKHIVNAHRNCTIHAESGTMLMLSSPVHFVGDVRFRGSLEVVAQKDMISESCFVVRGNLTLEMDLKMRGCHSSGYGGALRILGDLAVIGRKLEFDDCRAKTGGAIFVEGRASMKAGAATFTNCKASESGMSKKAAKKRGHIANSWNYSGGGLTVGGFLLVQNSQITFDRCRAFNSGGALYAVGGFGQEGGSVNFRACTSANEAGGMYVATSFHVEGGTMHFNNCRSKSGGGLFLHCSSSCGLNQSSLAFRSCSSTFGGGLSVYGKLGLTHSSARFENCSATTEGGGIWVGQNSSISAQAGSLLDFKQCAAGNYGGGLHFEYAKISIDASNVSFAECTAGKAGGGFDSGSGRLSHSFGRMSFLSCKAFRGSAFDSALGADLAEVHIERCTDLGAEIQSSKGNVSVQSLTFLYDGPSAGFEASVVARNITILEVNCTAIHKCSLYANTMRVRSLLCPPGREAKSSSVYGQFQHGCTLCAPGYFQPLPWHNPYCLPCPDEVQTCNAVSVTMQAGYMLHVPNLSSISDFAELDSVKQTYFCANAASCPGGRLAYQNQTAMCSPGTTGEGCDWCAPGYAPGDFTNPYDKVKCPTSKSGWVLAASYLFGKDIFVFALASSSVLGARAGRKDSAVLVNLFMAFGTAASHCLVALIQAEIFAEHSAFFRDFLAGWGVVIDVGTGQTSAGTPLFCFTMAWYGNSDLKMFWVNFVLSALPAALMVCILGRMKGLWLSIIVGSNCFMPAFCARVSMLLIVFRQTKNGRLTFFYPVDDDELGVYLSTTFIMLTLLFSATTFSCLRATHSDQDPRSMHVLYLAAPYKPNFASWEVERLLRKMMLSVICAAFPITMHPRTQLCLVVIVLIVSAVLYIKLQPYSLAAFNDMEISLLLAGSAMAVLTVLSAGTPGSWATGLAGIRFSAGVAAVAIAAGCTAWMATLIGTAFIRERKKD